MGVEHPYLAILAVIAFTAAVMSVMYFFIHTYTEMLKAPVLSTYAEACYTDTSAYLNVTLKHERGLPVVLRRVEVYSDRGAVAYSPGASLGGIYVRLEGFDGRLGVGQVGVVKMVYPRDYFTTGRTYYGVVLFDVGNTVFTFQLVECPRPAPAPPVALRARLVDIGTVAGNGTVTALGLVRLASVTVDLYSRSVLYYDTFDSDPFAEGRLNINETTRCTWGYDSVGKFIYVNAASRPHDYGGECLATVVGIGLPSSGRVYVASTIRVISGEGYADVALVQDPTALYTLGAYFGPKPAHQGYAIWMYNEARTGTKWVNLSRYSSSTYYNTTYNIVAEYDPGTGRLALWSNRALVVSATNTTVRPAQVGLGAYAAENSNKHAAAVGEGVFVVFDNLVVTVDTPPWLVYVRGVPAGWRVVLKDSGGRVVGGAVSVNGTVALDVWDYLIVPGGVIEVYDGSGTLVGSRTFDYVVGGDVYVVSVSVQEFTGLAVGVGGSDRVLLFNITGGVESPVLVYVVRAGTLFNGSADVAVGLGRLHLLNSTGVYYLQAGSWARVTGACRATGRGARLEVVRDTLVVVPGEGNSSICLYNTTSGAASLYSLTGYDVTEYTSTAVAGDVVYVSLYDVARARPVVAAYRVTGGAVDPAGLYNVTGCRLVGLAYGSTGRLYYVLEYGGIYEVDTVTGELRLVPALLPFTPRGYGDRLEYYGGYLAIVRGDGTTELYVLSLAQLL
jgi:hypothetical protein